MPQNVNVQQKVERYTGNSSCVISIAWNTPVNVAQDDISLYIIYINGISYYILNKTESIDQNLILTTFPVCPCAEHSVSVSAVDVCGHEGQRSPSIIPEQESFSDTGMCKFTPSTNPGINHVCILMCYQYYVHHCEKRDQKLLIWLLIISMLLCFKT